MFIIVLLIAVVVLMVASQWTLFEKAGKPGWASIVPIYNNLVMLEIAGKPWWWLLVMMFVPIVNVVFAIWAFNLYIKSYGKTETYTVLCLLLAPIFLPMLAFDKNTQYVGPAGNGYNKNELY